MSRAVRDVEGEIDGLQALPLANFVAARNALAARLGIAGRDGDAARVKSLKKPSASAWAVNQLLFAAPKVLAALRAAGDRLRDKAVDRPSAMGARRDALAAARKKVEELLVAGGHAAPPDVLRRISSTLEAVVAWGNAPGRPAVGRLTQDLSAPGFDEIASLGLLGAGAPRPRLALVPPPRVAEREPARKPGSAPPPGPRPPSPARVRALEARKQREAKRLLAEKTREAARARTTLQAAERQLETARQKQQDLETALSSAMRLERKLREEVAAARKGMEASDAALAALSPLKETRRP
jgi:hypothetical protein